MKMNDANISKEYGLTFASHKSYKQGAESQHKLQLFCFITENKRLVIFILVDRYFNQSNLNYRKKYLTSAQIHCSNQLDSATRGSLDLRKE